MRENIVVVATVCKDSKGATMGIKTKKFHRFSPIVAEGSAALLPIELALSLGISHLVLKGDAKLVIQGICMDKTTAIGKYPMLSSIANNFSTEFW
ncbi:hypothetical protein TorRG33x02_207550 [Trema orientale]|uniref:RNase H type-1 domain-containing protein n=1 Tax=Trema orientale TaxID=63057 RepID=A0A2P5ED72_TREOI|nr:hypothetical protein TorRG33x02_207550 [Trema orientale]